MQSLCQRKASACALHTKPPLAPMMQGLALPHKHRLQGPAAKSICECVPKHLLISQPHPPSPMQFINPAPFGFTLSLASEKGRRHALPDMFRTEAASRRRPRPRARQSAIGTADASTQTAIGLVAGPKLCIDDIREAPLYESRRGYEFFVLAIDHRQSASMQGFDLRS